MNYKVKALLFMFFITSTLCNDALAQKVYNDMTLEELLDIDVVITASKHPEDLFETPLSTTIISKEEIAESGVTSIPEALRLSQGLIVREITPGNYDIHIRGYDDITKNVYLTLSYNTTILVMIDNRIVYSYFSGGTFWETLPVGLNDVERIEVVRGPASSLYGPNAVTGVINIITSHANKKGKNISVNSQIGTNNAKNASLNIGYNWEGKTKLSFSSNFSERHRFDNKYYDFNKKDYVDVDSLTMFVSPVKDVNTNEQWQFEDYQEELGAYYDEGLSLRRLGGNIFFTHNYGVHSNVDIAVGAQKSQSQRTGFLNIATPLSQTESESYYLNAKIKHNNLSGQFNINSGKDENIYKFNSYKFTNLEANLEYFKEFRKLSIRPGINYKYLSYNSPFTYKERFSFNELNYEFKDEARETYSFSAFILAEWKPTSKLRVIGATRLDKFGFNKNNFINYEIASTYRLNKNNLLRIVHSKASKSPFFFDTYLNSNIIINYDHSVEGSSEAISVPVNLDVNGQEDLKYPTITSTEIGWRTKIKNRLSLDLEMFYSKVDNFVNPNAYHDYTTTQELDEFGNPGTLLSISADGYVKFENYNLNASQFGIGFTLDYDFNDKLKAKLFGTYQKTNISGRKDIDVELTNIQFETNDAGDILTTTLSNKTNPTQWSEDATPSFFGGFSLNYKPNKKWSFGTDGYLYSNHEFASYNYYQINDLENIEDDKAHMYIKTNVVLNAKTSFQFNKHTAVNITAKNLLGKHREYGFADDIGSILLLGLQWQF
ncbi:TonB-dependent receptor plug domain-containing protein [Winogradskyella undariae]|uniref:TonB-dependent receptor plug domain-containing protein n=1 Tax=Winogradskyella undariae TaxID=1285465 RepID=UPI0015CE6C0C|nr:TonB-dependent receptor plug domain-containing protein [Winogradskyella undariae]